MRCEELISAEQIQLRVRELAQEITDRYRGKKLVLIGVMKGAFVFLADLIRHIDPQEVDISVDFIAVSSYEGTKSSGTVRTGKDF